jgi:hypothetical protein
MEKIYNNNSKLNTTDSVYESFNNFIFSNDIKVIGKLLHRFDFFNKTKNIPGDIVEIGVFKGSGVASFSKFLEIYCPNSNKKIVGFDIFKNNDQEILNKYDENDKKNMNVVYSRVDEKELTLQSVTNRLDNMNIHKKYILIEGDVEETLPEFVKNNPGFRIALLYIDCDLDKPTYYSLKYLWDRVLPGGIIIFDEYEHHSFSESVGVDRFLKENNITYNIISTNFMAPTAYIIKN